MGGMALIVSSRRGLTRFYPLTSFARLNAGAQFLPNTAAQFLPPTANRVPEFLAFESFDCETSNDRASGEVVFIHEPAEQPIKSSTGPSGVFGRIESDESS